jgi:hypothetical protein
METTRDFKTHSGVLSGQGRYAEKMDRRALAGHVKELGVEYSDTLTSVSCLCLGPRPVRGAFAYMYPKHSRPSTLSEFNHMLLRRSHTEKPRK